MPKDERLCHSDVEDEVHFVLGCLVLVNARRTNVLNSVRTS